MSFAICNLSLVPVRNEPTDRAEMVSQLLFGELFHIEKQEGSWLFITCDFDSYQGWIDVKQCRPVSNEFVEIFKSSPSPVSTEFLQIVFNESRKIAIPVVLGSTLPNFINNSFYIDDDKYSFDGPSFLASNVTRERICETAILYLNSPYLWGGRSPFGIDCSGLVQIVYRINGYKLRRDAAQQSTQGGQVSFASEAAPGDLAFFENEEGNIIHTGIILPGNKIIHSSGRVKIDDLDHEGIYSQEFQRYTHKLRLIKSIL
jgi:hypothetical protein